MVRDEARFLGGAGILDQIEAWVSWRVRDWPDFEQRTLAMAVREATHQLRGNEELAVDVKLVRQPDELEVTVSAGPQRYREVLLYRRAA